MKMICFFLFLNDARPARWGPPDGWEPPGARSRKVGSLKKRRMETLKLKICVEKTCSPFSSVWFPIALATGLFCYHKNIRVLRSHIIVKH